METIPNYRADSKSTAPLEVSSENRKEVNGLRPWDLFVKWLVENPNESKESRQLYLDTPQEVTQDARALYTRERYPRTVFSKIAQAWVVEEEWPAWVAYAKEKAYDHKARRLVV